MDLKQPDYLKRLKEIRNGALLLSLGCAYLCEAPFLQKIGLGIYSQIDVLQRDITALKKKFPGKFVHEIDTEAVLEEIRKISLWLQNPDQELNQKCMVGELGRELEDDVERLSSTIGSVRDQVEGKGLTYTKRDSLSKLFGGLRHFGSRIASEMATAVKVLVGLLLLSCLAFAVLFITMEKESDLQKSISSKQAQIRSQREIIAELEQEKRQILKESAAVRENDLGRQGQVEALEMDMKIHELDEKRQQAKIQIQTSEMEIQQQEKKLGEMKHKSFLQRLLRR